MIQLENEIIVLSLETISKLMEINPDSATLYLFYHKSAKMQKTNQIWTTNPFCKKGLGWGEKRFMKAKKVLKELDLIETLTERKTDGDFAKTYIHIKYLKSAVPPNSGDREDGSVSKEVPNALSSNNLNALSSLKINASVKKFISPTIEECRQYFSDKGEQAIEGETFFYHYNSNGWKVGKNKMKCWHSSVGGWINRNKKDTTGVKGNISQGQQLVIDQKRADLTDEIKRHKDMLISLSKTDEEIKEEIMDRYGHHIKALQINYDI